MDVKSFLETVRAFSFGGIATAGIGAIVFYRYRQHLPEVHPAVFISACGAIGTASQQAIQGVLTFLFKPVFGFLAFYEKLLEINVLSSTNRISEEKRQELVDKLCDKRFLQ